MMNRHTIFRQSVFLALAACSFFSPMANAQNATPWWQKIVKKAVHRAEHKAVNIGTSTDKTPTNAASTTNTTTRKNTTSGKDITSAKDTTSATSTLPESKQKPEANPNNEVALRGAFYKYYRYMFSGNLKLRLKGFKNKSYRGSVISAGPPDYKIKSYKLDIGGLTTGWVLANDTTSSYWAWDRREGSLRVHVTIAAPGDKLPSGGAATINIFGTFIGNYTFSTGNDMTMTPVGPPSFADKIVMQNSGATYMAHYVKRTASPISSAYRGVSLDIIGIKPGMSLKAARHILVAHYKSSPSSSPKKLSMSYKDTIFLSSQTFVSELNDRNKDQSDRISVIFGNPAINNAVIGIIRKLNFSQTDAPKISQLMIALKRKYGPETEIVGQNRASSSHKTWIFGRHGLIRSSSAGTCPTVSPVADLDNYDPHSPGPSPRNYACVEASFAPLTGDTSRVAWVSLALYSLADTELSNRDAMKQMHAAVVADYKRVIKPEKVPAL